MKKLMGPFLGVVIFTTSMWIPHQVPLWDNFNVTEMFIIYALSLVKNMRTLLPCKNFHVYIILYMHQADLNYSYTFIIYF